MSDNKQAGSGQVDRRSAIASGACMGVGLAASYGTLGAMAGQFLYRAEGAAVGWQFVALASEIEPGQTREYITPSGAKVVIARRSDGEGEESLIALSNVCPHLGCQVHWEVQNQRFFCPCHNGAFNPQGEPTEGPVAKAKQQLTRYPLRIEDGLLFIEAPLGNAAEEAAV